MRIVSSVVWPGASSQILSRIAIPSYSVADGI
jgi:hypothetical protein